MSPSLRWWPSWWWPLVHLRSFRCRLLDGSHYTRPTYVVQIEPTQTTPKPLQTLAFIGVSQPHDGDTKTADTTATAAPRHGHTQGRHGHVTTAMSRDATTSRARRPRHGHDGRDTATATTRPQSHTKERARVIPHDTPKHNRTNVPTLHHATNTPRGGVSPRRKKQGRWLSSADAECSLEHFWITCYSRSLHIFSGCNRCCTLHIVYNVPWIDVDGGEASLSHINVWPSTHKGSVKILDAVRSAVRLVYLGRGLYGLVPIILGWSAIMLAQPFGCRVRFPRFALGFMGVAACEIDGIARISPLEHVGDKRLPALIRWLMTEGEARPNGCIYTYTFLAVGGKSQSTIPLSCQLGQ